MAKGFLIAPWKAVLKAIPASAETHNSDRYSDHCVCLYESTRPVSNMFVQLDLHPLFNSFS